MKIPLAFLVLTTAAYVSGAMTGKYSSGRDNGPCSSAGFFANTDDCRKFYRCAEHETEVEGEPLLVKFEFQCPVGTAFDESAVTCNHPYNIPNLPENCPTEVESPVDNEDTAVQLLPGNDGSHLIDNQKGQQTSKVVSPTFQIFRPPFTVDPFQTQPFHFPQVYFPSSNAFYSFKK